MTNEITKKLDRVLDISNMYLANKKDKLEIENELEIIYSDIYEYIYTLEVNYYYYEEKLRNIFSTARIASGIEVDPSLTSAMAKNQMPELICFMKSRLS